MTKNKPNLGINSPYRQFGCYYEKNIKKYLESCQFITSNQPTCQTGAVFTDGKKILCLSNKSYCFKPGAFTNRVHNPDFKWEEPTPEEYCEWYFKKYGKVKT